MSQRLDLLVLTAILFILFCSPRPIQFKIACFLLKFKRRKERSIYQHILLTGRQNNSCIRHCFSHYIPPYSVHLEKSDYIYSSIFYTPREIRLYIYIPPYSIHLEKLYHTWIYIPPYSIHLEKSDYIYIPPYSIHLEKSDYTWLYISPYSIHLEKSDYIFISLYISQYSIHLEKLY